MRKLILVGLMLLASQIAQAKIDVTVGPEVSYVSYRERSLPFGRDIIDVKIDGVMYGIKGTAEYTDKIYLAVDGKYAIGEVDYSGSGTIDDIEDTMYEVRGLVGVQIQKVIVYSGYGYRYLNDDMSGKLTSTGLFGYERESNYQYVPIGIKVWKLQGEIDVLTVGEQVSHLDAIGVGFPELRHKQNRGAGFKLSLDLNKTIWNMDLHLTPFFRAWKVQDSKTDDGFREPRNTSLELGGQVAIKF